MDLKGKSRRERLGFKYSLGPDQAALTQEFHFRQDQTFHHLYVRLDEALMQ